MGHNFVQDLNGCDTVLSRLEFCCLNVSSSSLSLVMRAIAATCIAADDGNVA